MPFARLREDVVGAVDLVDQLGRGVATILRRHAGMGGAALDVDMESRLPLRQTVSTSGGSPGSMLNSTSCWAAEALDQLRACRASPRSSLVSSSKVMVAESVEADLVQQLSAVRR